MLRYGKKILLTVLAGAMIANMNIQVFAANPVMKESKENVEVIALSEDVSEEILSEIGDAVGATLVYDDGTVEPIHALVTVEKISSMLRTEENSYAVAVSAKVVSDSGDKNTNNTNASATLQLIWTDGVGLKNSIDEVSGTLNVIKGSVESATVRYGDGMRSAILWTEKSVGNASSFKYTPNIVVADPTADYSIAFKNESVTLCLKVSASVFQ